MGLSKGLIQLCEELMVTNGWSSEHRAKTSEYLCFLLKRAKGEIPTGARFMRDFVLRHPEYKKDSVVSPNIAYDLMEVVDSLEDPESKLGQWHRATLLGSSEL